MQAAPEHAKQPDRHQDRQRQQQAGERQSGERADHQDEHGQRPREELDRHDPEAGHETAGLGGYVGWRGRFVVWVHTPWTRRAPCV
jgi:hypothetical protein